MRMILKLAPIPKRTQNEAVPFGEASVVNKKWEGLTAALNLSRVLMYLRGGSKDEDIGSELPTLSKYIF